MSDHKKFKPGERSGRLIWDLDGGESIAILLDGGEKIVVSFIKKSGRRARLLVETTREVEIRRPFKEPEPKMGIQ